MSTVFAVFADYDFTDGRSYCVDKSISLLGIFTTLKDAKRRQREIEVMRERTRTAYGYRDYDSLYDLLFDQFRNGQISEEEFDTKHDELLADEEKDRQNARCPDSEEDQMYLSMTCCYIRKFELDLAITESLFAVSYYE